MNARLADLCGRYVTTNVKSSASLHRMRPWPGLVGLGAPRTAFPSRSFHVGLRAQGEHEKQPFRIIHHIRIGGLRGFNWSLGRSEEQDAWDAEAEVQKAAILEKLMKGRQPADLKMRCA